MKYIVKLSKFKEKPLIYDYVDEKQYYNTLLYNIKYNRLRRRR